MSQRGSEHRARMQTSYADWSKRRAVLEAYKAQPGDMRTTPAPSFCVSKLFPELAGRSATTIRLHPRYGEEPPVDASKVGGTLLWPAGESWPVCPAHDIPLVAVQHPRTSQGSSPRRARMERLNDSTFRSFVEGAAGLTVVDFYSDSCPPCRVLAPILEELAAKNPNVRFAKISTVEAPRVAKDLNISAVPTLVFYKDGEIAEGVVGLRSKTEIQRIINELRG